MLCRNFLQKTPETAVLPRTDLTRTASETLSSALCVQSLTSVRSLPCLLHFERRLQTYISFMASDPSSLPAARPFDVQQETPWACKNQTTAVLVSSPGSVLQVCGLAFPTGRWLCRKLPQPPAVSLRKVWPSCGQSPRLLEANKPSSRPRAEAC